jgi:hypothetical protein
MIDKHQTNMETICWGDYLIDDFNGEDGESPDTDQLNNSALLMDGNTRAGKWRGKYGDFKKGR